MFTPSRLNATRAFTNKFAFVIKTTASEQGSKTPSSQRRTVFYEANVQKTLIQVRLGSCFPYSFHVGDVRFLKVFKLHDYKTINGTDCVKSIRVLV